ncbi:MAG: NAD(P)/FAD-dependent oxidoreductase [Schwartzia sp.]|nr:NAD(P)/FAD-dependent oxidoreductase [Schwartzia sp. (in: firmicutes)]
MERKTDVVVIGGGITGTAILAALARLDLSCVLAEKEPDIAAGTTKANSAILHAGFDAPTGSMKAKMNVEGNRLYHELQNELNLNIEWTGSLVCATTEEEEAQIKELKARGEANGVLGLEIWDGGKVREKEPNLSSAIRSALWAPTAGICWPFGMAAAFAENAVENGAEILRDCEVTGIRFADGKGFAVETTQGAIHAKYVVNAAGVFADKIAAMAGDTSFSIHPRKGEYILFDKTAQDKLVKGIVFPAPTKTTKGILVCATTHGNTFIGPNAQDQDSREDTAVTTPGMDEIIAGAKKLVPELPMGAAITQFAGIRAVSDTNDFIVGESKTVKGLYHAAGIQSPGLTSAPAIAKLLAEEIAKVSGAKSKANVKTGRPAQPVFRELPAEEQAALIAKDARYGRVICRCETITEGEIVDAIKRPCGARTVDGVKRRTRAGMGRCQGGFCGPRVIEILSRELDIPVPKVRKDGADSYMYEEKLGGGRK